MTRYLRYKFIGVPSATKTPKTAPSIEPLLTKYTLHYSALLITINNELRRFPKDIQERIRDDFLTYINSVTHIGSHSVPDLTRSPQLAFTFINTDRSIEFGIPSIADLYQSPPAALELNQRQYKALAKFYNKMAAVMIKTIQGFRLLIDATKLANQIKKRGDVPPSRPDVFTRLFHFEDVAHTSPKTGAQKTITHITPTDTFNFCERADDMYQQGFEWHRDLVRIDDGYQLSYYFRRLNKDHFTIRIPQDLTAYITVKDNVVDIHFDSDASSELIQKVLTDVDKWLDRLAELDKEQRQEELNTDSDATLKGGSSSAASTPAGTPQRAPRPAAPAIPHYPKRLELTADSFQAGWLLPYAKENSTIISPLTPTSSTYHKEAVRGISITVDKGFAEYFLLYGARVTELAELEKNERQASIARKVGNFANSIVEHFPIAQRVSGDGYCGIYVTLSSFFDHLLADSPDERAEKLTLFKYILWGDNDNSDPSRDKAISILDACFKNETLTYPHLYQSIHEHPDMFNSPRSDKPESLMRYLAHTFVQGCLRVFKDVIKEHKPLEGHDKIKTFVSEKWSLFLYGILSNLDIRSTNYTDKCQTDARDMPPKLEKVQPFIQNVFSNPKNNGKNISEFPDIAWEIFETCYLGHGINYQYEIVAWCARLIGMKTEIIREGQPLAESARRDYDLGTTHIAYIIPTGAHYDRLISPKQMTSMYGVSEEDLAPVKKVFDKETLMQRLCIEVDRSIALPKAVARATLKKKTGSGPKRGDGRGRTSSKAAHPSSSSASTARKSDLPRPPSPLGQQVEYANGRVSNPRDEHGGTAANGVPRSSGQGSQGMVPSITRV